MHNNFEFYLIRIIKGEINTYTAKSIRVVLGAFAKIYGAIVKLRLFMFRHRLFRQEILGCTVISIGNITAGGTGKTPVTEMFARALERGGRKVAILSRGYKKKKGSFLKKILKKKQLFNLPDVVSDGKKLLLSSKVAGDEPYMLARNLQNVLVLVDKNRVRAAEYAIKQFGTDTILMDDGFQYLPMNRQYDIVLVDCTNPFDNYKLLPRGLLREHVRNLKRANYIFLTKTEKIESTNGLREEIREVNKDADIIECIHDSKYLENIFTGERFDLSELNNKEILALSAIASPESFEDSLCRLGARIVVSKRFIDHYRYTRRDMEHFIAECEKHSIQTIVTTEKDAVRISEFDTGLVRILFLRVEIKIVKGAVDFSDFVSTLCYE